MSVCEWCDQELTSDEEVLSLGRVGTLLCENDRKDAENDHL